MAEKNIGITLAFNNLISHQRGTLEITDKLEIPARKFTTGTEAGEKERIENGSPLESQQEGEY